MKKRGKMAIQIGNELHFVDVAETAQTFNSDELLSLAAEPKSKTAGNGDEDIDFSYDETLKSAKEVEQAEQQLVINEKLRQKQMINTRKIAKEQARLATLENERKLIMADGLIHREDGTIVDPADHHIVSGVNVY